MNEITQFMLNVLLGMAPFIGVAIIWGAIRIPGELQRIVAALQKGN